MAKTLLNELPPDGAVKEYLPQLFKSYDSLALPYVVASFFLWSDNPKIPPKAFFLKACHAQLAYMEQGYDHLITAVPKSDELSLAYLRMLISGPFRAVSDLISLENVDKQYFIRCTELQRWPANVLYNFCIATRIPFEYKEHLPYFGKLLDKGYNPTLAYLLSYSTAGKEGKLPRQFPVANHLWLDPSSDWGLILKGEMTGITPPFKEYPQGVTPCNVIWGTSTDYRQLINAPDEWVSEFYKLPIEVVAPPPVPPKSKYDMMLDMIAAEQAAAQGGQAPVPNNGQIQVNVPPGGWGAPAPINWVGQANHIQMHDGIFAAPAQPEQPMHAIIDDDDDDIDDFDEWEPDEPEADFDEDDDD